MVRGMNTAWVLPVVTVLATLFAAWAVVATVLLAKAKTPNVEADVRVPLTVHSFDLVSVTGPGTWQLPERDESLLHLYALWAVNQELRYAPPTLVITKKFKDLVKRLFPQAQVQDEGAGTMVASDAYRISAGHNGRALPAHHHAFRRTLQNVLQDQLTPHKGHDVFYAEHAQHNLENYAIAVNAKTIVTNGPSDFTILGSRIIDSLASRHHYNQLICEITMADYTGVTAEGRIITKGNRDANPLYQKAPLVPNIQDFLKTTPPKKPS